MGAIIANAQLFGVHGLDLLAILRGTDARRPVILYATSMTPELATPARDFRVTVLPAPVVVETVVAAVRAALRAAPATPRPR